MQIYSSRNCNAVGARQSSADSSKTKKNLRDNTVRHGIGGLALRQGDWKYIPATAGAGGMGSGANAVDARFAAANIPETLLFNLAMDPSEQNNLFAKYPEKAKELAKQLETIKGAPAKPAQARR